MSLNRKKSFSLSFTTWSRRILPESIALGFDQLPKKKDIPFAVLSMALGLCSGHAFST